MSQSSKKSTAQPGRSHVWRDEFILILSLIVFTGVIYALSDTLSSMLQGSALVWAGILLALVPAFIWLAFFYMQDRDEPEPKSYVIGVFFLGCLLASAVGTPIVDSIFHVSKWMYADSITTLLAGILVIGFVQEYLKYAAVRFSVYHSDEFNEATDGIVYATAAGLGYATFLNMQFVISSGGVDLGVGVIRMAVVALAHASFAGIVGYFLGRAKFESEPVWWMPLGVTIAAVMNGTFNWLRGQVVQTGVNLTGASTNPWLGLVLAAFVALITMGVLVSLMRRDVGAKHEK